MGQTEVLGTELEAIHEAIEALRPGDCREQCPLGKEIVALTVRDTVEDQLSPESAEALARDRFSRFCGTCTISGHVSVEPTNETTSEPKWVRRNFGMHLVV